MPLQFGLAAAKAAQSLQSHIPATAKASGGGSRKAVADTETVSGKAVMKKEGKKTSYERYRYYKQEKQEKETR